MSIIGNCSLAFGESETGETDLNNSPIDHIVDGLDTNSRVEQWVSNLEAHKIILSVPEVLSDICIKNFTKGCVLGANCYKYHDIPDFINLVIPNLPYEDLIDTYIFILGKHRLFELLLDSCAKGFKILYRINNLFNCVNDILINVTNDKTPYIKKIVDYLLDLEVSFDQIIDRMLEDNIEKKLEEYISFIDILLEMIFLHYREHLCSHWLVVKNMLNYKINNRGLFNKLIDHGLIEDIVNDCDYENVILAQNIVNDIFTQYPPLIKLELITSASFDKLFTILDHEDCLERELLTNEMEKLNLPLFNTNPNFGCIKKENIIENNTIFYVKSSSIQSPSIQYTRNNSLQSEANSLSSTHTQLNEEYVQNIQQTINEGNKSRFFELIEKFKNDSQREQFVLHAVVGLKSQKPQNVYNLIYPLVLEHMDMDFLKNYDLKCVLEMLCVNVLAILEEQKEYEYASNILLLFKDLKSLVKTKLYNNLYKSEYSEGGKYLYFCKILVKGTFLKEAWELIKQPDLKLLYPISEWAVTKNEVLDKHLKCLVLQDIFQFSLHNDIKLAKHIFLYFYENPRLIINYFDIVKLFIDLTTIMLRREQYLEDIKEMLGIIDIGWYQRLNPSVMRSLFIYVAREISIKDVVELYEVCCKAKLYSFIKGDEEKIVLQSDMEDVEILMMLCIYFYKKVKNNYTLTDLLLLLRNPTALTQLPSTDLPSSQCIVEEFRYRVERILVRWFSGICDVDYSDYNSRTITIKRAYLRKAYEDYCKRL